jgi:hypothetical protein
MQVRIKTVKQAAIDIVKATPTGQQASERQIKAAVKLVTSGKVHKYDATTLLVESQSQAGVAYELVKGQCACACRWSKAGKVCAHRLAAALYYAYTTAPAYAPATALDALFPEVA